MSTAVWDDSAERVGRLDAVRLLALSFDACRNNRGRLILRAAAGHIQAPYASRAALSSWEQVTVVSSVEAAYE
jgi:hypothetical protein